MSSTQPERVLPTRQSLLSRLKDWNDQDSWRDFFETYWRLIYDVARKAGLEDGEAQDVVQETIVSVAHQMPGFRYDPSKGRFRSWLHQITRRRIADQLRKRYRDSAMVTPMSFAPGTADGDPIESMAAASESTIDAIWDQEWEQHLTAMALERVKRNVRPDHFQIFDLNVIQGWPPSKVARSLGVSMPLVYVVRHRLGRLLRKEISRLQDAGG